MPGKPNTVSRKKGFAMGMDPVTACANVIAAILNYATEVRRTMTPEHREAYDAIVLADIKWWRDKFGLDK